MVRHFMNEMFEINSLFNICYPKTYAMHINLFQVMNYYNL